MALIMRANAVPPGDVLRLQAMTAVENEKKALTI
jgi:hypothetical protein